MYGSAADANVLPIVTITFLKILSFIRISLIQANTNLIYTVGDSNNISGQSWTEFYYSIICLIWSDFLMSGVVD